MHPPLSSLRRGQGPGGHKGLLPAWSLQLTEPCWGGGILCPSPPGPALLAGGGAGGTFSLGLFDPKPSWTCSLHDTQTDGVAETYLAPCRASAGKAEREICPGTGCRRSSFKKVEKSHKNQLKYLTLTRQHQNLSCLMLPENLCVGAPKATPGSSRRTRRTRHIRPLGSDPSQREAAKQNQQWEKVQWGRGWGSRGDGR